MKNLIYIFCFIVLGSVIGNSQSKRIVKKSPKNIGSDLYTLYEQKNQRSAILNNPNYIINEEGLIKVYIQRGMTEDTHLLIDKEQVEKNLGISILKCHKNVASFYTNPDDIGRLIEIIPDGYMLKSVKRPKSSNQGPATINSDTYNVSGVGGNGKKIAVIDLGFQNYPLSQNAGFAPPSDQIEVLDLSPNDLTTETHGTSCVETIYDHAPEADYLIIKISDRFDFVDAIDYCIQSNVDVISVSLSFFGDGHFDNTGIVAEAVKEANDQDIIVFLSAGNARLRHWEGEYADAFSNGIHEWFGNDEGNDITIEAGSSVSIVMTWESEWDDYELYLVDPLSNDDVASSTQSDNTELIEFTNNTSTDKVYEIEVSGGQGAYPDFELFVISNGCSCFPEHNITSGSTTQNVSDNLTVIVGAVFWDEFHWDDAIPADYSSEGPTNSGNQAPHIVSPTFTTTFVDGGPFGGTSCATPNAAGAAIAFWSAHSFYSAKGLLDIIYRKAELVKDWGDNGADNQYGYGGINLYDYDANNEYATKFSNNTLGLGSLPWNDIWQADNFAPLGSNVIFLGENYTEEEQEDVGHIIRWRMVYKSFHENTVIK